MFIFMLLNIAKNLNYKIDLLKLIYLSLQL